MNTHFSNLMALVIRRLRSQMDYKEMKPQNVAERAGLSPSTVSNALNAIEKGTSPTLESLFLMGQAVGMSVWEMVKPENPLDMEPRLSRQAVEFALIYDSLSERNKETIAALMRVFPKE